MKTIKWIKQNWSDPVWSKVFAWVITGILGLIITAIITIINNLIKNGTLNVSYADFIKIVKTDITLPLWTYIVAILIAIGFLLMRRFRKRKEIREKKTINYRSKKSKVQSNKIIDQLIKFESFNIFDATKKLSSTINNEFLKHDQGMFCIWAYIADVHNIIRDNTRYMYILGYATNNGNELGNPSLAKYPNAWALLRISPNNGNHRGQWRFWCNSIEREQTFINYDKSLNGGWHLFSVAWSKSENYIRFIIDKEIVGENDFINWPSDYSGSMFIGTWPNRNADHYFDSKVGPWKYFYSKYDETLIEIYFNKKPE
ncbi:MAG: hypothetical protein JW870_10325 [Candidatus Delongbacteria bacterium]|nr:hypothetical protein [Candidatus Delongbacteria bacterium]